MLSTIYKYNDVEITCVSLACGERRLNISQVAKLLRVPPAGTLKVNMAKVSGFHGWLYVNNETLEYFVSHAPNEMDRAIFRAWATTNGLWPKIKKDERALDNALDTMCYPCHESIATYLARTESTPSHLNDFFNVPFRMVLNMTLVRDLMPVLDLNDPIDTYINRDELRVIDGRLFVTLDGLEKLVVTAFGVDVRFIFKGQAKVLLRMASIKEGERFEDTEGIIRMGRSVYITFDGGLKYIANCEEGHYNALWNSFLHSFCSKETKTYRARNIFIYGSDQIRFYKNMLNLDDVLTYLKVDLSWRRKLVELKDEVAAVAPIEKTAKIKKFDINPRSYGSIKILENFICMNDVCALLYINFPYFLVRIGDISVHDNDIYMQLEVAKKIMDCSANYQLYKVCENIEKSYTPNIYYITFHEHMIRQAWIGRLYINLNDVLKVLNTTELANINLRHIISIYDETYCDVWTLYVLLKSAPNCKLLRTWANATGFMPHHLYTEKGAKKMLELCSGRDIAEDIEDWMSKLPQTPYECENNTSKHRPKKIAFESETMRIIGNKVNLSDVIQILGINGMPDLFASPKQIMTADSQLFVTMNVICQLYTSSIMDNNIIKQLDNLLNVKVSADFLDLLMF